MRYWAARCGRRQLFLWDATLSELSAGPSAKISGRLPAVVLAVRAKGKPRHALTPPKGRGQTSLSS